MPQKFDDLLREAHQRSLWQVTAGYLVAAWIVYEASVSLTEGLGLPGWVPPVALLLVAAGLPIVLATALVQRGGPWSARRGAGTERLEGLESVADEIVPGRQDTDSVPIGGGPAPAVSGAAAARGPVPAARRLFTWHRAITGGVLAFAALGVVSTGFVAARAACLPPAATLQCSGELAEDATLLLADFDNPAPGSDVGDVVTEALRVDLASSSKVRLADAAAVQEALARMRAGEDARLDAATARQLALREGYPAVLTGEVAALGNGFVLTAHVVSAADGAELAPFRVTARNGDDLIDAVDELSERIRGKIGESLRSARGGEPLERTTTASLEALRLYTQAVRDLDAGGARPAAIGLLEEAVRVDPEFATAWRKLGIEKRNLGSDPAGATAALTRAFDLSDRLPERERYLVRGSYHADRDEVDEAIAAYEQAIARFGDDVALNNVAIHYNDRGQPERAEAALRRAMEGGPGPTNYVNLVEALWQQRRDGEMVALADSGVAAFPGDISVAGTAIGARGLLRRWDAADSLFQAADGVYRGRPDWEFGSQNRALFMNLVGGRSRAAEANLDRLAAVSQDLGVQGLAMVSRLARAVTLTQRGDTAAARAHLERTLAERPLASLPPDARPYGVVAGLALYVGRPDQARRTLDAWLADTAAVQPSPWERTDLEANIALVAGTARGAPPSLAAVEVACALCARQIEGDWALANGDTARARSAYAAYDTLRPPQGDVLTHWAVHLARILETAARLAEASGDRQAAADYWARFIDQWERADPELQPRVEAARRRLQALVGAGG